MKHILRQKYLNTYIAHPFFFKLEVFAKTNQYLTGPSGPWPRKVVSWAKDQPAK